MRRGTATLAIVAGLLAATGCGDRNAPEGDDALRAHERRVADLETRIEDLVTRLSATGRGAYADGPVLALDATGSQSLLHRLHQLQEELAGARSALQKHLAQLDRVRDSLGRARVENDELRSELATLERYRKSVEITQQELQEKKDVIAELNAALLQAQKRRLAIERAYADFARTFLQLEPLHTTEFLDLQSEIRQHVERLWPDDLDTDGRDATED